MLNRRYESTQRSFRSVHRQRRVQNVTRLSLVESVGTISYQPSESESLENREPNAAPPSVSRDKKGRKSDKKSKWFSFSRKSNSTIPQSNSGLGAQDNIIPIETSPDILSPITPPPTLEDLGVPLPAPPTSLMDSLSYSDRQQESSDNTREMVVGSLEIERPEQEATGNTDRVAAILDAINRSDTQPRPQSDVTPSDEESQAMSPTHRPSDLDRVRAVQAHKNISAARRSRTSMQNEREGGDTDEETDVNVQPPRKSSTPDAPPSREESQGVDSGNEREVTVAKEQKDEEKQAEEEERIKSDRAGSRKRVLKGLKESPALKFITRPDLYTFLSSSGVSQLSFLLLSLSTVLLTSSSVCVVLFVDSRPVSRY